jgi:hypothetical protein
LKSGVLEAVVLVCAAAAGRFQAMLAHSLGKLFVLVNDKVVAHLYVV